jgi:hypothetical protein
VKKISKKAEKKLKPGQHKVPGVVVRYHAEFSPARFTKSSKEKMTSKAVARGTPALLVTKRIQKRSKGSPHNAMTWQQHVCITTGEEKKRKGKKRKERKEENAAGQHTKCHK